MPPLTPSSVTPYSYRGRPAFGKVARAGRIFPDRVNGADVACRRAKKSPDGYYANGQTNMKTWLIIATVLLCLVGLLCLPPVGGWVFSAVARIPAVRDAISARTWENKTQGEKACDRFLDPIRLHRYAEAVPEMTGDAAREWDAPLLEREWRDRERARGPIIGWLPDSSLHVGILPDAYGADFVIRHSRGPDSRARITAAPVGGAWRVTGFAPLP
jgi:hypothetical protein